MATRRGLCDHSGGGCRRRLVTLAAAAAHSRPASTSSTSRHRHRQEGALVTGLTAEDFELVEDGKPQTISYFSEAIPARPTTLGDVLPLHLGAAARHQRQHGARHHRRPHRRSIKFLNANDAASTSRWSTSTPRCGSRATARTSIARLIERIRTQQAGRLDGALRRDRRLSRRRRPPGRPEDPAALHRWRRHPQRADASPSCSTCSRRRTSRSTRSATSSTRSSSAGRSSRCSCSGWRTITGGQAFFPTSVKELDKVYEKIQREIAARYSLGYVSSDTRRGRRVAQGRNQAEAPGPQERRSCAREPATSRRTAKAAIEP